jgi:hypothetical protein
MKGERRRNPHLVTKNVQEFSDMRAHRWKPAVVELRASPFQPKPFF